jgi:hypothetical protein
LASLAVLIGATLEVVDLGVTSRLLGLDKRPAVKELIAILGLVLVVFGLATEYRAGIHIHKQTEIIETALNKANRDLAGVTAIAKADARAAELHAQSALANAGKAEGKAVSSLDAVHAANVQIAGLSATERGLAGEQSALGGSLMAARGDVEILKNDSRYLKGATTVLEGRVSSTAARQRMITADVLDLERAMRPRSVGSIGFDGPAPADTWFAGIQQFAGMHVAIQPEPNDREAIHLAEELAFVLARFGWRPDVIGPTRSHVSHMQDGIRVMYPSLAHWNFKKQGPPPFAPWANASQVLANDLTKAGLGIGDLPVNQVGWITDDASPQFNIGIKFAPPLKGVYVQVGPRPVAAALARIAQRHPNGR